jgi:CTP-dependent riboflavin kinase
MFEDHLDPTKDMRISTMLFYLYRNPDADSSDTQQHLAQEFAVSERTARKTIQAALGHGLVSRTASGGSGDLNYQLHITDDGMKLLGKVDYDKFAPADLSGMVDHAAARWAGGN